MQQWPSIRNMPAFLIWIWLQISMRLLNSLTVLLWLLPQFAPRPLSKMNHLIRKSTANGFSQTWPDHTSSHPIWMLAVWTFQIALPPKGSHTRPWATGDRGGKMEPKY
ncbi:hypothetical protein I7I53_07793 [Histoplasma capsulatum var. duboisii H88]|uniref:Uncharacterized protein n=1 Tax=Ajellomyces capsulatus (strain H88) TaxID=544711 RepID=A0A8A1LH20_AJEC8|nr:hypothetical protein I7I53_07793 [Histoplasma capsulatum var. duboisii H88]